jgi:hypothetical protein
MDIPRLCRALTVPGELAEQFVEANKTKQYIGGLDVVTHSTNQIADILQSDFFICTMTMAKSLKLYVAIPTFPFLNSNFPSST